MYIDRIYVSNNLYNNLGLFSRPALFAKRAGLSLTGFTIIEVMIAMVILLMVFTSISFVYITTQRMCYTGIRELTTAVTSIQRKSQSPEEFLSRIIRLANWAEIGDSRKRIEIDIPQNSSKTDIIQSSFYFGEYGGTDGGELGSIFYDPDISLDGDELELYTNIYKIFEEGNYQPIFSINQDLPYLVRVYFGYFKGDEFVDENRRKVEFKIKMRNI